MDDATRAREIRASAGAGLSLEVDEDGIAVLEFDQPDAETNRFTPELLERFRSVVAEVRRRADDGEIKGLVVASGKRDTFVVGVDVAVIANVRSAAAGTTGARQGQLAFEALADLPVPTVAAINGTCLGGGTEMVLACDWRLAADTPEVEIGLPEVNLGIFPGFGGSQRLPRLISLERALPMILQGSSQTGERARRIGLVDAVVPAPILRDEACRWALERGKRRGAAPAPEDRGLARRVRRWALEGTPIGRAVVFRKAAASVARATKGHYPAPPLALRTVKEGLRMDFGEALKLEAERVGQLAVSPEARNLIGLFFLRQAARRAKEGYEGAAPRPVKRVGVVGAGIMGGGIAQLAAYQQRPVRLKDIALEPLEEAMAVAHERFVERRRKGKLDDDDVRRRMALISPTLEYSGFAQVELVVEAVVERADVKRSVFGDLEGVVGPETVIATNTSSLTLASLEDALERPERLVGLHFFNPVHRMPLVEVVRGRRTDPVTVATASAFAVEMGKIPIVVRDAPGFLVNRVLAPYMNEALLLLREGASVEAIDRALVAFGMPMGPLRLFDEVGLDVAAKVAEQLAPVLGDRIPQDAAAAELLERGRKGKKGGGGFYRYPADGKPELDPEVQLQLGGSGTVDERQIRDRCILVLLNEAAWALGEGVVDSPLAVDAAMVFGTGFAPFRGGPFRWAEGEGLDSIRARMSELADRYGERFAPAPWLAERERPLYPADWPMKIDKLGETT